MASDADALFALINQYEASAYALYDHQWPTSLPEIVGITEWFARGNSYLAVDLAQAGVGDTVLVNSEGNGARQVLKMGEQVPIRSLIVGVIDRVDVEDKESRWPA